MATAYSSVSAGRRNFLRGNFNNRCDVIRPPWALAEERFRASCTRCDECITACHAHLLSRGDDGYPQVSFSDAGCDFCADCLKACQAGALQGAAGGDPQLAWRHVPRINDTCLSVRGVVCRACGDYCEPRALRFSLLTRGRALPEIDAASCTGCGQCLAVCPANAISIHVAQEVTS
jgi:ferredoxin-type protein NapF